MTETQKKIPISLKETALKHPDLQINIEDVTDVPRSSRLNPKFLLLAYLINSSYSNNEELPLDFLDDNKIYGEKKLKHWISQIFSLSEKKNKHRLMIELLSYVLMLNKTNRALQQIEDQKYANIEYDVETEIYMHPLEDEYEDEDEDEYDY
jgi:hypothetical protein